MRTAAPLDLGHNGHARPRSRRDEDRTAREPRRSDVRALRDRSDVEALRDRSVAHARWQTIEVRHLAALAAVAREGSFRRAAERLGYVQSAISGQIAHLEQAVSTRLIDRASGTHTIELTPAGQVLLRHTDEIIGRLETAYMAVTLLANRTAAALRVAGLEHLAPWRIARVLREFRQRHPFARVSLEDPVTDVLGAELVAQGKLELLVCELPAARGSLTQLVLEEDHYALLVSRGSEHAERTDPLAAAEIAALSPIVPSSCARSRGLDVQLHELGIERRASVRLESAATAQVIVANGLGEAIMPSRLVDRSDPRTVALDLSHLFVPRTIVLTFDPEREHSPAVDGFVQALREACDAEAKRTNEAKQEPTLKGVPAPVGADRAATDE
jgi:DNA-binding transcriptional LysR family regulator